MKTYDLIGIAMSTHLLAEVTDALFSETATKEQIIQSANKLFEENEWVCDCESYKVVIAGLVIRAFVESGRFPMVVTDKLEEIILSKKINYVSF